MKTINETELNAILVGLRLLQTHDYKMEELGLEIEWIDELCESLNCEEFSSLPLKEEEVEIWQLVSDTQYGTNCDLYTSEDEAKNAFITTVMEYSGMVENLGDNTDPTYDEALAAWEQYTETCASNLDTVFVDVQTVKFATKHCVEVDTEYDCSVCPECGSSKITGERFEANGTSAYQVCSCYDCDARWDDNYVLTGYEITESGKSEVDTKTQIKNATFRSIWDGDVVIESPCLVNLSTGRVIDIQVVDVDVDDLEVLESQEVELADGQCFEVEENDDGYAINIIKEA